MSVDNAQGYSLRFPQTPTTTTTTMTMTMTAAPPPWRVTRVPARGAAPCLARRTSRRPPRTVRSHPLAPSTFTAATAQPAAAAAAAAQEAEAEAEEAAAAVVLRRCRAALRPRTRAAAGKARHPVPPAAAVSTSLSATTTRACRRTRPVWRAAAGPRVSSKLRRVLLPPFLTFSPLRRLSAAARPDQHHQHAATRRHPDRGERQPSGQSGGLCGAGNVGDDRTRGQWRRPDRRRREQRCGRCLGSRQSGFAAVRRRGRVRRGR